MIIAIDGPAASGKSSVARAVARELNALFLNTGAMYRAVGAAALEAEVDLDDAIACGAVAETLELDFDAAGGILVDGESVVLDGEVLGSAASRVAAHPEVRSEMVARQRGISEGRDVVTEGRDTTTVVFPDAEHKFFLWASAEERARRRADQEGAPEKLNTYIADLKARDMRDTERPIAPLRQAEGATRINTDGMPLADVVARVMQQVRGT
jgi:CMP/dCMP kinase